MLQLDAGWPAGLATMNGNYEMIIESEKQFAREVTLGVVAQQPGMKNANDFSLLSYLFHCIHCAEGLAAGKLTIRIVTGATLFEQKRSDGRYIEYKRHNRFVSFWFQRANFRMAAAAMQKRRWQEIMRS